ncbi:hypothetical protein Hanom_Chr00s000004g01608951 [Helianthus anomalus]
MASGLSGLEENLWAKLGLITKHRLTLTTNFSINLYMFCIKGLHFVVRLGSTKTLERPCSTTLRQHCSKIQSTILPIRRH